MFLQIKHRMGSIFNKNRAERYKYNKKEHVLVPLKVLNGYFLKRSIELDYTVSNSVTW